MTTEVTVYGHEVKRRWDYWLMVTMIPLSASFYQLTEALESAAKSVAEFNRVAHAEQLRAYLRNEANRHPRPQRTSG